MILTPFQINGQIFPLEVKKMIADGYQQALDQLKQLQYKIRI
jgi:hypothetical protein